MEDNFAAMFSEDWYFIALLFLMLCAVNSSIALKQGRVAGTWFLLSIFLSPLLAFVLLFLVPKPSSKEDSQ